MGAFFLSQTQNRWGIQMDEQQLFEKVKRNKFANLDELCSFVQDDIGLSDGGNAGLFWSGYEDGLKELQEEIGSDNIIDSIPDDLLVEYIRSEMVALEA